MNRKQKRKKGTKIKGDKQNKQNGRTKSKHTNNYSKSK